MKQILMMAILAIAFSGFSLYAQQHDEHGASATKGKALDDWTNDPSESKDSKDDTSTK
jgi:hypothetical protein